MQIEVCKHVRRKDAVDLLLQALFNRKLIPRELLLQVREVSDHLLEADLAHLVLWILDLLRDLLCLLPHHLHLHEDLVHFLEDFCEQDGVVVEFIAIYDTLNCTFIRLPREVLADFVREVQGNLGGDQLLALIGYERQQHNF